MKLDDLVRALLDLNIKFDDKRVLMQSRLAGYARTAVLKVSVDTINGQQVIILEDGDNGESEI